MTANPINIAPYTAQLAKWPSAGQHIMAQYDHSTIIVYQAFSKEIADYALEHKTFGGAFSYDRMSWIKPNFLWMMYRSGWGTKPGQEKILALRLERAFFDAILAAACPTGFVPSLYPNEEAWKSALNISTALVQWDPDHAPDGTACTRRAIQLGLRGKVLEAYGRAKLMDVIDMSGFADAQKEHAKAPFSALQVPEERPYLPGNKRICARLDLASVPG